MIFQRWPAWSEGYATNGISCEAATPATGYLWGWLERTLRSDRHFLYLQVKNSLPKTSSQRAYSKKMYNIFYVLIMTYFGVEIFILWATEYFKNVFIGGYHGRKGIYVSKIQWFQLHFFVCKNLRVSHSKCGHQRNN